MDTTTISHVMIDSEVNHKWTLFYDFLQFWGKAPNVSTTYNNNTHNAPALSATTKLCTYRHKNRHKVNNKTTNFYEFSDKNQKHKQKTSFTSII